VSGWWRRVIGADRWDGTTGRPRSANGASSFHLAWQVPPGEWVAAEATLEVTVAPSVDALYFWALQVSFTEVGRHGGAAHLGLQWHPGHPGRTAINWGGYGAGGGELAGSESLLPSATGNPNTRDFAWHPARPYRLRIRRSGEPAPGAPPGATSWRGEVVDLAGGGAVTVVRELFAPGRHLADALVWSEVFADCDAPPTEVRWRELAVIDERGRTVPVPAVRVSYQAVGDGGCSQTDSSVEAGAVVQRTSTPRATPQGALLAVSRS
jgi:hypothetical protein